MMNKKVVTFGEIMLRLTPPSFLRIVQARSFDAIYAGAEANVAITLASLGIPADFVTRLPENELGDACINYIRQFGVGVDKIIRGGNRLGVYFLEIGAAHRSYKVIYDRANSSFATIKPGMIDWEKVFSDASWFHWTGITPAVSRGAAETCLEAIKKARKMGLTISCDLNYRAKLWKWGKTAEEVMSELVRYVDLVIGNEYASEKFFGIKVSDAMEEKSYVFVAKRLMEMFPRLKLVAITLRGGMSASHNTWSGILYDGKNLYKAPVYDITHIVDRVGAGDAFSGGLIYGLLTYENDLQKALNFAVAASCLKHTLYGDSFVIRVEEVEELMQGITSGGISR